jgi:hypothetical protein
VVSPWRSVPVRSLSILLLALPAATGAQTGAVIPERENLRAAPRGVVIAEVLRGTRLPVGAARDGWREATLEGWVWAASVRSERRDGHHLVVTAGGGENLRAIPNGDIIARLRTGMLLDSLGAEGNWLRVRRSAWVWDASVSMEAPAAPTAAAPGPAATANPPAPTATPRAAPAPRATPAARVTPGAAEPGAARAREFATAGSGGVVVLTQPAGDTAARVPRGGSLEVVAREGDWSRVRIDGWVFTAALSVDDTATAVLRDVGREVLRRDPDRYRGRLVEWTVQFISLQNAERFRTEFLEGEPFILARGPGDDAGFVYLAVPAERLAEVQRLAPLQRVRVLGRVRVARSPLTDAPVLDLLEITRPHDPARR